MLYILRIFFVNDANPFVAASFSIPAMQVVAENDSTVEVCITMTTAPAGGSLAKKVYLTLSTMSGTGKILLRIARELRSKEECKYSLASEEDGDFIALMKSVAFTPGFFDGNMVCANVTVFPDGLVECEEDFTVTLTLNTIEDNLFLGNNSTDVTLMDSDGMIFNNASSKCFQTLKSPCSWILFCAYNGNCS